MAARISDDFSLRGQRAISHAFDRRTLPLDTRTDTWLQFAAADAVFGCVTIMSEYSYNRFATNSHKLAGSLTTVRGRKVFGKRGVAGTLEEAVFRLVLVHSQTLGAGLKANIFGT